MQSILYCKAVDFREQWEENLLQEANEDSDESREEPSRRYLENSLEHPILGPPTEAKHLPEAEAVIPGHTLLRPSLGMLKSAVKFPHRDPESGSGVYGNINKLGLRYDGKNERVLYSGFRRTGSPADYIVLAPLKTKSPNIKFILSSVVLDLDGDKNIERKLLNALQLTEQARYPKATRIIQLTQKLPKLPKLRKVSKTTLRKYLRNRDNAEVDKRTSEMASNEGSNEILEKTVLDEDNVNKSEWFWNTRDAFNHIKIRQDAPEHSELLPVSLGDAVRNWWFYHQDDFLAFKNNLE